MYIVNKIIGQVILIFCIFVYLSSGNPVNTTVEGKYPINNGNHTTTGSPPPLSNPPHEYPLNATEPPMKFPYDYLLMPNVTAPICWSNISLAFWTQNLHSPSNQTKRHMKMLRLSFAMLNAKFNEHLIGLISTSDQIRMLLYPNSTYLEDLFDGLSKQYNFSGLNETSNAKNEFKIIPDIPTDSSNQSLTVPILLMIILILLLYIAFLHRKLKFAQYKDREILIQDELADPWATR